jgi:hypothetical protein
MGSIMPTPLPKQKPGLLFDEFRSPGFGFDDTFDEISYRGRGGTAVGADGLVGALGAGGPPGGPNCGDIGPVCGFQALWKK